MVVRFSLTIVFLSYVSLEFNISLSIQNSVVIIDMNLFNLSDYWLCSLSPDWFASFGILMLFASSSSNRLPNLECFSCLHSPSLTYLMNSNGLYNLFGIAIWRRMPHLFLTWAWSEQASSWLFAFLFKALRSRFSVYGLYSTDCSFLVWISGILRQMNIFSLRIWNNQRGNNLRLNFDKPK